MGNKKSPLNEGSQIVKLPKQSKEQTAAWREELSMIRKVAEMNTQVADWTTRGALSWMIYVVYLSGYVYHLDFWDGFSGIIVRGIYAVSLLIVFGALILMLRRMLVSSMFSDAAYFYMAFPFSISAQVRGRLLVSTVYLALVMLVVEIQMIAVPEKGLTYLVSRLLLHGVPAGQIGILVLAGLLTLLLVGAEFCAVLFTAVALSSLRRKREAVPGRYAGLFLLLAAGIIFLLGMEYWMLLGPLHGTAGAAEYSSLLWRLMVLGVLQMIQLEWITRRLIRFLEKRYEV